MKLIWLKNHGADVFRKQGLDDTEIKYLKVATMMTEEYNLDYNEALEIIEEYRRKQ